MHALRTTSTGVDEQGVPVPYKQLTAVGSTLALPHIVYPVPAPHCIIRYLVPGTAI